MKTNTADREAIRTMRQELARLEDYIWNCCLTVDNQDYTDAIEKAAYLRSALGLPELPEV